MPLIPALWRQRQADLNAFETSLVYKVSSRTTSTVIQKNPVTKKERKTKKKKETGRGKVNFSGLSWRSGSRQGWPWRSIETAAWREDFLGSVSPVSH